MVKVMMTSLGRIPGIYIHSTLIFPLALLVVSVDAISKANNPIDKYEDVIQHGIVFSEEGYYGGWPANHGIWCWGDEILVGFVKASYKNENNSLHTYDPLTARTQYARSNDGGINWSIEDAFENGQTAWAHDNNIDEGRATKPLPMVESINDFTNPNFILTFFRHNNHNGPTHFYYSEDKGSLWQGPYTFPDLGTKGVASRTDYIVNGKQELIAFLTVAKSNKKEGRVVVVKTTDGGLTWKILSWVGQEHDGFDIMPSSLRISENKLLTVIRTRTKDNLDLLTSYFSNDDGKTWAKGRNPVFDTGKSGSPPTLIKLRDGRLALGYIFRDDSNSRVNVRFSSDNGMTWSDEVVLRGEDGANRDVGYPRMVQRSDGKIVIVYYWNNANLKDQKPYRYIAYTVFDPKNFKNDSK